MQLVDDRPLRGSDVPVEPGMDDERFAAERERSRADIGICQPVAEGLRLGASIAEDHHPAAAALHEIRGRKDEHGVDCLLHTHAAVVLESEPGHDRCQSLDI